jgi:hypothetical protein
MPTGVVHIDQAVRVLARSERGRQAMRDTLSMLDNGGISLDMSGQHALLSLIVAAFTTAPGSAREAMRDALETAGVR